MEKPFLAPWLYEEQATGLSVTILILLQEFLMITFTADPTVGESSFGCSGSSRDKAAPEPAGGRWGVVSEAEADD